MTIGDGISIAAICGLASIALHYGHEFVASGSFVLGIMSVVAPGAVRHMVGWLLP